MIDLKSLLVPVVSSVLALTALAAPARAADPYGIQAGSAAGVLFEDCTDHLISYSVAPPAGATTWSIDFVVQAPDGTGAGGAIVTTLMPTTGLVPVQLCGSSHVPGTFTVTGTYRVLVGTTMTRTPVTPFSFDMRLPAGSVSAEPSDTRPRRGQRVAVRVHVQDERPTGELFGTSGASVLLQRWKGGDWVKVRGAKGVTSNNGAVRLRFRHTWAGKTRFRVFANFGYPGRAASPSFTLRTKR